MSAHQLIILIFILIIGQVNPQLKAFPEAEGYGCFSAGGRGGKLYRVNSLDDSGPGTLREAVESKGARTVVFTVSGYIDLKSPLEIKNDSITIAGQTAPGAGICLRYYPFIISANNVIIRYLRFRLGDMYKFQDDAINGIEKRHDIIIDHCSASWGVDEVMSFWNIENLTVQWCIISESLNSSIHKKGNHGYGGIWGGTNATYHHNLIAHHSSRTPRFSGGSTVTASGVDFVNNVIYNWGYNSVYGGEEGSFNIVSNYYKPGPATLKKVKNRIAEPWSSGQWYISNNHIEGDTSVTLDNWKGGVDIKDNDIFEIRSYLPVKEISINPESPGTAYLRVLENTGACLPARDDIDERIIDEVRSGKATYSGKGYSREFKLPEELITGIIDSQADAGGWPDMKSVNGPCDKDSDGLPDEWEIMNGLDPDNPADSNLLSENGYTQIELYINSITSTSNP